MKLIFKILPLLSIYTSFSIIYSNEINHKSNLLYQKAKKFLLKAESNLENYNKYKNKAIYFLTESHKLGHKKAYYDLSILMAEEQPNSNKELLITLIKAVRDYPKEAKYWFEIGYYLEHNHEDIIYALLCYKAAVKLGHNESLFSIGRIFLEKNNIEKTLIYFDQSIKNNNNLQILSLILSILQQRSELKNSIYYYPAFINCLKKICQIQEPNNKDYFYELLDTDFSYLKNHFCMGNI